MFQIIECLLKHHRPKFADALSRFIQGGRDYFKYDLYHLKVVPGFILFSKLFYNTGLKVIIVPTLSHDVYSTNFSLKTTLI